MENLPQKYVVDDSEDDEIDYGYYNFDDFTDKTVEELSLEIKPVDIEALGRLVNLNKARMVSKYSDSVNQYEITGNDQTGVLSKLSFKEEIKNANLDLKNRLIEQPINNLQLSGDTIQLITIDQN